MVSCEVNTAKQVAALAALEIVNPVQAVATALILLPPTVYTEEVSTPPKTAIPAVPVSKLMPLTFALLAATIIWLANCVKVVCKLVKSVELRV